MRAGETGLREMDLAAFGGRSGVDYPLNSDAPRLFSFCEGDHGLLTTLVTQTTLGPRRFQAQDRPITARIRT